MNIVLTRLLYCKDEVELMVVYSLLQKKCLNEVLFWIAEYYHSGYEQETWNLIFKCYYDFYAVLNPTIEDALFKKYIVWKTKPDIQYLTDVVYSLWLKSNNCDVFQLRMRIQQQLHTNTMKETKFRGRRPLWIKKFEYKSVALSLHKQNIPNILYFIHTMDSDTLYNIFVQYFSTMLKIKTSICHSKSFWNALQGHKMDHLKSHILMAMYTLMHTDESLVDTKRIIYRHLPSHIEYIEKLMQHPGPLWTFLYTTRKYGVNTIIGAFDLARFHHTDLKSLIWYHWEYYAYKNPVWNKRFVEFNGVLNEEEKTVNFPEDDDHEGDFHEKYGYEPDEQKKETQLKCTKQIDHIPLKEWICSLFDEPSHTFVGVFNY